jgi:hypothetical protein
MLRNRTSFLHQNQYTGDSFHPNTGKAKDHEYDVPRRIDYLLDDGAGTTEHLIADNRPVADYSKPGDYNPATHQYGNISGAPGPGKNKSLGGVSVTDHLGKARQPDTTGFPKATVLRPHDDGFEFIPPDRYEDDGYMSPPPSPFHIPAALDTETTDMDKDKSEFADLMHDKKLVEKAKYDPAQDKTRMELSSIRQSVPVDWVANLAAFDALAASTDTPAGHIPDGQLYLPTINQNQQLTALNRQLAWVVPDGYCIFNAIGTVIGQTGAEIRATVLEGIEKNVNNVHDWITSEYGGGNVETIAGATETVQSIAVFWNDPRADIVLPLVAHIMGRGFTVIQDNQPLQDINGGGDYLVRVTNPHLHYHGTRPL